MMVGIPASIDADALCMPRGADSPREARLEEFGPKWLPGNPAWSELQRWWLRHPHGANTPNWDIALGCMIEGRPGLILVEAKANWPELGLAGKTLANDASPNSRENHDQIGRAIDEAQQGWQRVDQRVRFSRDSHYQLANRLAFTWKLAMLGIPVVLIYLGFTGDEGIRADAGAPFADAADWRAAFAGYTRSIIPLELLDRRIDLGPAPAWLTLQSRAVMEVSAPRPYDHVR